jgi:hypothetical protein
MVYQYQYRPSCQYKSGIQLYKKPYVDHSPPPKNVERDISEYVDREKDTFFLANYLLIAKFPRPSSHISNTVDKLNKSKLSGLVNVFTLVLPLVVVLMLLPLSLAINDGEFDHGGDG